MSELKPFDAEKLAAIRKEAAEWRRLDRLTTICDTIDTMTEDELRQVEARIALTRARLKPEHLEL